MSGVSEGEEENVWKGVVFVMKTNARGTPDKWDAMKRLMLFGFHDERKLIMREM